MARTRIDRTAPPIRPRRLPRMDESKVVYRDAEVPSGAMRAGYILTIVINGLLIYVVQNLVEWDWLPFLTEDFNDAVPAIVWSMIATIVVSTVYLFTRARGVKILGEFVLAAFGFWATMRLYLVWPFDFTVYPDFDWDFIARLVLGLAVFGTGVALLANFVRLFRLAR